MSIPREIFTLLRQYAAVVPIFQLKLDDSHVNQLTHDLLVQHIIANPHFESYPPTLSYRQSFWKWNPDIEIDSQVFAVLVERDTGRHVFSLGNSRLLIKHNASNISVPSLPISRPPAPSYATYYWRLNPECDANAPSIDFSQYISATLLESRTLIESGTTGLRTWLAAFHLAHYLICHPEHVVNKRVLELGSGIGFLGIVVGSLQMSLEPDAEHKSFLHLTDVNSDVVSRCIKNVRLPSNKTSSNTRIDFGSLDWSDALLPDHSSLRRHLQADINPDVILGADLVFDPSLIPALISTLSLAFESGSQRYALIALNVRKEETHALFRSTALDHGLIIEDIKTPTERNDFRDIVNWSVDHVDSVRLLKITRRREQPN
ncbi:putative methyltransferase-domain-containing protein [Mucidula mucida]|nr:putative methyltransferase-domain-containing protein [Mucidula mucida]